MSLLKAIKAQLGLSNTPANNFTLDASAGNGTMKLARGNAGATTQDILTVDANGNVLVDGNNLNLFSAKSLASSGYQKLPSGLIIQWGKLDPVALAANSNASTAVTFNLAFPNAALVAASTKLSVSAANIGNVAADVRLSTLTTTGMTVDRNNRDISYSVTFGFTWFAIGY